MRKDNRTVAVLGGGKDSLGIIRRIKEMGFYTLVFDYDENAPARKYLADHFVKLSCYDAWDILRYFKLQTLWQPSAVLCAGTDCPDVMAVLNKHFSLAGPKRRTAEISTNKWMQKKLFSEAGIRIPPWVAGIDANKKLTAKEWVVVKPVSSRGSRGVSRVKPDETLAEAIKLAASYDNSEHTIVEKWIDGIQLSSESLVQNGKIIYTAFSQRNYSRLAETHPHIIEDGGDMPPSIQPIFENDYNKKAEVELQKCVNTVGLRQGTLKGDLVWDGNNIWIIEVACRLSGGSFCSEQIPGVWGIDFVGYATRIALGEKIYPGEIRPYQKRYMSQRFVIPEGTTMHPERGPGFTRFGQTRREAQHRAAKAVKNELRNM